MSLTLQYWRRQSGLTLDQLSSDTGLTKSYLSKIERGLHSPSIAAAINIAKALNVTVEQLFGHGEVKDPVSIVRASDDRATANTFHLSLVAGTGPTDLMRAFIVRPRPKPTRNRIMSHHAGEEVLYVLSGQIQVQIGKSVEILRKGDCVHFNSIIPHKLTALTEERTEALVVVVNKDA